MFHQIKVFSVFFFIAYFIVSLFPVRTQALTYRRIHDKKPPDYVPNELVVTFKEVPDLVTDKTPGRIPNLPGVTTLNQNLKVRSVKPVKNPGEKTALVKFPPGTNVESAAKKYKALPSVAAAEPNYILTTQFVPNDPYFNGANPLSGYQWNLERIKMRPAWDKVPSRGVNTIKVAVIDTGVAFENYGTFVKAPELSQVTFQNPLQIVSYSWSSDCQFPTLLSVPINNAHPNDRDGHGTHVTSTIVQAINNGSHAAGIADHVTIIPIKAADDLCSYFTVVDLIAALNHAVISGAQVINLSLGTSSYSPSLEQAINNALAAGVTVVAATGNESTRTYSPGVIYPAAFNGVIAVGATRYDNQRADYSNFASGKVSLLAPGGQWLNDTATGLLDGNSDALPDAIVAQTINPANPSQFTAITNPNPNYGNYRCLAPVTCSDGSPGCVTLDDACGLKFGTSMATPHVTAVAALIKSVNPNLSPAQIKTILENTAQKNVFPAPGYLPDQHGAGLLDADAAVTQALSTVVKLGDYDGDNNIDILEFWRLKLKFNTQSNPENLLGDSLINLFDFGKLLTLMWH